MSYLQLVKGRYRVRMVIPPALRAILGKASLARMVLVVKGATAFFRKAIEQHRKAKTVVLVGPTQPYVNVMLEAGAELRLLRRVRWLDVDTGEPCPAPGPVTCFILR
jgi:hypothetical protein